MSEEVVSFRVSSEQLTRIEAVAAAEGEAKRAWFVRDVILDYVTDYLEQHPETMGRHLEATLEAQRAEMERLQAAHAETTARLHRDATSPPPTPPATQRDTTPASVTADLTSDTAAG